MSCKECVVSAACVAAESPRDLFLVQCIFCAEVYMDITDPDGDIELRHIPDWDCPWVTSSGMRRADGGDDEWLALLRLVACPKCGKHGIRKLSFLIKESKRSSLLR